MSAPTLRLHAFLDRSLANGPGARAVIWTRGCTLGCPGCFNPETHAADGGDDVSVRELMQRIDAVRNRIDGVTLSGGEPLQQPDAVIDLLLRIRAETRLSTLLFTGFEPDEIDRLPRATELLGALDILVAGRYRADAPVRRGLLGSANQTVRFLTDRHGPADLARVPASEVLISPTGELSVTGIDPLVTP